MRRSGPTCWAGAALCAIALTVGPVSTAHGEGRSVGDVAERLEALGEEILEASAELDAARGRLGRRMAAASAASARADAADARLARALGRVAALARTPQAELLIDPDRPGEAAAATAALRAAVEELEDLQAAAAAAAAESSRLAAAAADEEAAARAVLTALRGQMAEAQTLMTERREAAAADLGARAREPLDLTVALAPLSRRAEPRGGEAALEAAPRGGDDAPQAEESDDRLAPSLASRPIRRLEPEPPQRIEIEPEPEPERPALQFDAQGGDAVSPARGRRERASSRGLNGLIIWTAPYADVIAPWDAVVVHVDEMSVYGGLVILEPQMGYSVLMSGMGVVDVSVGERVTAGQTLGQMDGPPPVSEEFLYEESAQSGLAEERLYLEVLRGRRPVDPTPWFGVD